MFSTPTLTPLPATIDSSPSLSLLLVLSSCNEFVTWIVAPGSSHQVLEGTSTRFDSKHTRASGLPFFFFSRQFLNLKRSACLCQKMSQNLHFPWNLGFIPNDSYFSGTKVNSLFLNETLAFVPFQNFFSFFFLAFLWETCWTTWPLPFFIVCSSWVRIEINLSTVHSSFWALYEVLRISNSKGRESRIYHTKKSSPKTTFIDLSLWYQLVSFIACSRTPPTPSYFVLVNKLK